MLFLPRGILPSVSERLARRRPARGPGATTGTDTARPVDPAVRMEAAR
jgi:hypothetical protein